MKSVNLQNNFTDIPKPMENGLKHRIFDADI